MYRYAAFLLLFSFIAPLALAQAYNPVIYADVPDMSMVGWGILIK
jgi:hypothetical protein